MPATTTKVVFADLSNPRVRQVSPAGIITTLAGTGTAGTAGDGGPATSAQISSPTGVALAIDGSLRSEARLNAIHREPRRHVCSAHDAEAR